LDTTYRDLILGHSLQGRDVHYIQPGEEALKQAMAVYTAWRDGQLGNVDQGAVPDFCLFLKMYQSPIFAM
jgi:hypothetical protein